VISWDSLAFQPEFTATASNVGYGWWSNDIGGHYHGVKDDELMARWVQLGLFSPILRLHCSESPFNTREPWAFGPESRGVITKALQFRHRLIPYLYSSAVRASTEGKNLVEPMYYDYPGVAEAYKFKIQYNYGSELMVVPIVSPRDKATVMGKTEGWLPPGRWVDIFTETVYDGDRVVVLHRRLEEYPVLAKEGSIIPLDIETGEGLKNGCPIPTGIEIWIAVGADGKFELVEDDGKGATIEDVVFAKTIIHFDQSSGKITIGPTENPVLKERTWSIRLLSHTPTSDIHLTVDSSSSTTLSVDKGIINLGTHPSTSQLTLSLGSNPQLDRKDVKQPIFELLSRAQMETDVKLSLWKAVEGVGEIPVGRLLSRLTAVKGEREVQEAIEELLLADLR
jgi:alpha-glucosidase (family GH31 glycosyl hydrolase)